MSKKGFTVIVIFLIIVVLIVIVAGVIWYYKSHGSVTPAQTGTPSGTSYLTIPEWGITLQEPSGIDVAYTPDVHYSGIYTSSSSEYIDLLSKQLADLGGANCGNGAFGVLSRSQTVPKDSAGDQMVSSSIATVNGWFYWFTGPQAPCSGGTIPAADQLEVQAASYFANNLQGAIQAVSTP